MKKFYNLAISFYKNLWLELRISYWVIKDSRNSISVRILEAFGATMVLILGVLPSVFVLWLVFNYAIG